MQLFIHHPFFFFFFFNDTATTEIYTLSLHDALPISRTSSTSACWSSTTATSRSTACWAWTSNRGSPARSEEHTSELQSLAYLVCRLLLEKKKKKNIYIQRIPLRRYISSNSQRRVDEK